MKKLLTALVAMMLVVVMSMMSFAGELNIGYYRPYGVAGVEGKDNYTKIEDAYDPIVTILYVDQYTILGTKGDESITLTCEDPINHPRVYCNYYTSGKLMDTIVTSETDPSRFMYFVNFPSLGDMFFYSYKQYA